MLSATRWLGQRGALARALHFESDHSSSWRTDLGDEPAGGGEHLFLHGSRGPARFGANGVIDARARPHVALGGVPPRRPASYRLQLNAPVLPIRSPPPSTSVPAVPSSRLSSGASGRRRGAGRRPRSLSPR